MSAAENGSKKNDGKEALKMGVLAKPVNMAFTLRADKAEEFRKLDGSEALAKVKKEAAKIKNIKMNVKGLLDDWDK